MAIVPTKSDGILSKEAKSIMAQIGHDLTQEARDGKLEPIVGREVELTRLVQILCRRTKNNAIVLGDPGVGKTALVEGLAQLMATGQVPVQLQGNRLVNLDMAGLVAGTQYRGQLEERTQKIVGELIAAKDVIAFIDEIHTLAGVGGEGSGNVTNMLKPALARGELQLIGTTTPDEYRRFIEKDPALARRFLVVQLNEPGVDETLAMLRGIKARFEQHHGVPIRDEALSAAVTLSARYVTDRFLPDKAIDLMDEAAASVRAAWTSIPPQIAMLRRRKEILEQTVLSIDQEPKNDGRRREQVMSELQGVDGALRPLEIDFEAQKTIFHGMLQAQSGFVASQNQYLQHLAQPGYGDAAVSRYVEIPTALGNLEQLERQWEAIPTERRFFHTEVTGNHVAQIIASRTGIPAARITTSEAERLLHIEEGLGRRVIGQEHAFGPVANAIRRSRAGLKDPKRPIGSFIFMGPTGVGKTELAKALAEFLFDKDDAMTRMDMSEYAEKHSCARLIGAPPGYVGYEEAGQLTEAVRRKPYQVVLFDEIEKAHPDISTVLLQVLDDGRLTDGQGRVVNFKNTVVIMTTNIGAISLGQLTDPVEIQRQARAQLLTHYKPEFVNRVDAIIVFRPLGTTEVQQIARLQLAKLAERAMGQGIDLDVTDRAAEYLAKVGFDPEFGARPLQRTIEAAVADPLSKMIIDGQVCSGDEVEVGLEGDTLTFNVGSFGGYGETDAHNDSVPILVATGAR